MRLRWTAIPLSLLLISLAVAEDARPGYADPEMPPYRVDVDGFNANERDIRAVLDSAGKELWRYFPDYEIEPFVVTRGHNGPIVLFGRNDRKEIVMRLDTSNTYWSQYAYQFAHEFCHILCGYEDDASTNKWFEETICETASLFAMRAMWRSWKNDPPYGNWRDYRDALRGYTDNTISTRKHIYDIYAKGLPAFYQEHKAELAANANLRDLNGAMSLILLRLFEEDPRRWEAVRWLNHKPSPQGETFSEHLTAWREAVPERHQAFVEKVAALYGVELRR
jgi:hypothetical protein